MRVCKPCFSFVVFLFVFVSISAQDVNKEGIVKDSLLNKITDIDTKLKEIAVRDTTKGFSAPLRIDTAYANNIQKKKFEQPRDKNGLLLLSHDWRPFDNNVMFSDTVIFDPIFLPIVFNGYTLPRDLDFRKKGFDKQKDSYHLISPDSTFAPLLKRVEHIEDMRQMYYINNPQKVKLNGLSFEDKPVIKEETIVERDPFKEFITPGNRIDLNAPEIEKISIKTVHWLKNGSHVLQLTQNNFSENWAGDNNFNLFSEHKFTLNYKKNKIAFNNLFEWRLSLQQMSTDTVNNINVIDDYFRTYSTFGIDAFKNWSYSSNLEIKTPLFNKYKVNDPNKEKQRAIFSPLEINLGIGMRYATEVNSKSNKYRKFKFTADISALSLNYKFVGDNGVNETWFGIDEEKKSKTEYGSSLNLNLSYNRNRYTDFTSRLKYFTNYEKVYVELENSFNFKFNDYLSTTLYLYIKFDDGVPFDRRDPKWAYFSYNEMLRFGLTYSW